MEPKPNKYKINVTNHSKQGDHVEFLIRITSPEDPNFILEFLERYSNLKTLHDTLCREYSSSTLFPPFPPKKFFGSTDPKFLIKRQSELDTYFTEITKSNDLYKLPSFQQWIEGLLQKFIKSFGKDKKDSNQTKEIQEKQPMTPEEMKKKVDHYSKQFYDFFSYQVDEKEEDDIESTYDQIIKESSCFKQKAIEESQLFTVIQGRENNFPGIDYNESELMYFDVIENKMRNRLNRVNTIMQNEIPSVYFVNNLIIPFKV